MSRCLRGNNWYSSYGAGTIHENAIKEKLFDTTKYTIDTVVSTGKPIDVFAIDRKRGVGLLIEAKDSPAVRYMVPKHGRGAKFVYTRKFNLHRDMESLRKADKFLIKYLDDNKVDTKWVKLLVVTGDINRGDKWIYSETYGCFVVNYYYLTPFVKWLDTKFWEEE